MACCIDSQHNRSVAVETRGKLINFETSCENEVNLIAGVNFKVKIAAGHHCARWLDQMHLNFLATSEEIASQLWRAGRLHNIFRVFKCRASCLNWLPAIALHTQSVRQDLNLHLLGGDRFGKFTLYDEIVIFAWLDKLLYDVGSCWHLSR